MRRFAFMFFHVGIILFAITLLCAGFFPAARAQQAAVMQDLTRRVETIESLNLDHRLTVIETKLDNLLGDHWTHLGTMVGTALLMLERAARAVAKKTAEE